MFFSVLLPEEGRENSNFLVDYEVLKPNDRFAWLVRCFPLSLSLATSIPHKCDVFLYEKKTGLIAESNKQIDMDTPIPEVDLSLDDLIAQKRKETGGGGKAPRPERRGKRKRNDTLAYPLSDPVDFQAIRFAKTKELTEMHTGFRFASQLFLFLRLPRLLPPSLQAPWMDVEAAAVVGVTTTADSSTIGAETSSRIGGGSEEAA